MASKGLLNVNFNAFCVADVVVVLGEESREGGKMNGCASSTEPPFTVGHERDREHMEAVSMEAVPMQADTGRERSHAAQPH